MAQFNTLPAGVKVNPTPFKVHIDEQKLQQFNELIKLSPVGPATYENTNNGRKYGMTREYLTNAKKIWENEFDWRKWEDRINSYPNYTMPVEYQGIELSIHFVALFSQKADAIPVAFHHGWPGSFLEFLRILDIFKERYQPETLPYHVIVTSLPGYAFSSGPPLDQDYTSDLAAGHLDKLMKNLGLDGYYAQGGDIGSFISRWQAVHSETCLGAHINMCASPPLGEGEMAAFSGSEKQALQSMRRFRKTGMSYYWMHGLRTSTIGLVLSASPIAMLSWIGEKFLEWTDQDPPLDDILASVSLYWLTDTFARCIYPYRSLGTSDAGKTRKPFGYSLFPNDIVTAPRSFVEKEFNLVFFAAHECGGHFAAMEKPKELLADFEEYVKRARSAAKL